MQVRLSDLLELARLCPVLQGLARLAGQAKATSPQLPALSDVPQTAPEGPSLSQKDRGAESLQSTQPRYEHNWTTTELF